MCHRGDFSVTEGTFIVNKKLSQRGSFSQRSDFFDTEGTLLSKTAIYYLEEELFFEREITAIEDKLF